MKLAAAEALAELAREDVPDEVAEAYPGRRLAFGPEYIIPTPFDPRLITRDPHRGCQGRCCKRASRVSRLRIGKLPPRAGCAA